MLEPILVVGLGPVHGEPTDLDLNFEVLSWRVASLQLLALDILGHGAARAQALAPAQAPSSAR